MSASCIVISPFIILSHHSARRSEMVLTPREARRLSRLNRQSQPRPFLRGRILSERLNDVERQVQPICLFRIDRELDSKARAAARQLHLRAGDRGTDASAEALQRCVQPDPGS